MQIQKDECYCEVFYCFLPFKYQKQKCFLTAGSFWATGEVTASQMATTAILQEMLLLQEVAPVPSFRGRMHTRESLHFAGPIHTLFLGRASPSPLQDEGFNLKWSKRTLPAQPIIKKNQGKVCQVSKWAAQMTPRNLALETPWEAAMWLCTSWFSSQTFRQLC